MSLTEFSLDSGAAVVDLPETAGDQFMVLDLALVVASNTNPRTVFNQPRLQELADSIKASGVHQPVLVRPLPPSRLQETFDGYRRGERPAYELIAGERRYRASKLAGVDTIPAMIRHLTDDQVLEVQLIENLQRDDLHAMEEAEGYERLCKTTGITKEEIGDKIGKSRGYVYARIKLLDLGSAARKAFYDGEIDSSRALVIARIPNEELQAKALDMATRKDYQGSLTFNFKEFVRWAQMNVMLKLGAARFKITDATLVPEAGSCKTCPKRTGAEPDIFADVDDADVCIDPACFHTKEAAHEATVVAQAKAKGQRIIPEREAKKLWQWEGSAIEGYVRADKPDPRVGGSKMLKTILGDDCPEPVLMQNPHKNGELIEVLPADKVTKLLKASGRITSHQARTDRVISADEAKRNALAKYEKAWRKRAIAAVHAAMAESVHGSEISETVSRLIAGELLDGLRGDERQHVCELLGLGKIADRSAIEDYLKGANMLQAEQMMYLLLMQHDMLQLVSYSTGKAMEPLRILAVAADYVVDLEPIKAAVQAELQPKPKPKAEPPPPDVLPAGRQKKNVRPPAAQAPRARKPTKEEVQLDIALAFQALDQAPEGASVEGHAAPAAQYAADAAVAGKSDQAPEGAGLNESAAPAAPAPSGDGHELAAGKASSEIGLGVRVRVRRTLAGTGAPYTDKQGVVSGKVIGADRWQVNFSGISRVGRFPKIAEFDADALEVVA